MNIPKPFHKKDQKRSLTSLRGSTTSLSSMGGKKSCINMEDLMQFEAARQRALAQMDPSIYDDPFSEFVPQRIFMNHIDSFNGSHITDYLINATRSLEKEGEDEDEDEDKQEKMVDDVDDEQFPLTETDSNIGYKKKKYVDTYQIMGSLEFFNNPKYSRPEGILELLDNEKKGEFLDKLLTCGFIIYDITSDLYCHAKQVEEARWVLENIVKRLEIMEKNQASTFSTFTHCRVFILISTLLTWAKTKPIDPEDPSLPFTERDFRKRRPHPNYKIHCQFEKKVIELGKRYPKNLKTIVIGSGIPYGHEEDVLHFLFKMAWQDAPFLPIFRPGNNILPVIHIDSLASIVHTIIQTFPQKYKYIIAMDPDSVTMKQIVKLLAQNLGNGNTKTLDKEEALLFPEIKQRNYDMLTANINTAPGFILDNTLIRWGTVLPFAENIPFLILQFKTARELSPVKVFIHGPPASGKTFMANRLSLYYDIPHLHEKGIIEEKIKTLNEKIKGITDREMQKAEQEKIKIEGDEAQEEEDEDDDDGGENLETLQQTLREIEENMEKNENNKLDEEFVIRLFKEKLSSNVCQNKGYVIDGYPETMEQTKTLYAPLDDEGKEVEGDEEQGGDISRLCNMNIMPAYVESLDASDEYLINQVVKFPLMNLTQFEEHEMCRRLTEFRALNTEDNTPLIFYDEMEVHPMIYNMENDTDIHLKPTFEAIVNHVGPPRNYGKEVPLLEDIMEEKKRQNKLERLKELTSQRDEVKKIADERRQNLEKWMLLKNQELEMEEKALLLMGMPLRNYLMKYIFPCLTRGLVEVARLRPDDPVDFLSEFLFRENPEGKMFQPNYEEIEDKLAEAIKEYEMTGGTTSESRSSKKTFSTEKSVKSDAVSRVTDYKCSFVKTPSSKSGTQSKSSTKSKSLDKMGTGVCTCQKTPSLSTCSSDRTPSTASSCTCSVPEPCEPCEPCDTSDDDKYVDPCKCPC